MTSVAGVLSATRVAAYRLTTSADLTCTGPGSLDLSDYSSMKHGDVGAARRLAAPVARALVEQAPAVVTDPAEPVLPVAYKAVRPACWFLARAVLAHLDAARAAAGLGPGRLVRVAKDAVTVTDYATASAADRAAELEGIGFRLEDDLDGAQVVVVDDVRVTGNSEATILAALAGARPSAVALAYVAVVEGELARDPAVEARLNRHTVRACADMAGAVRRGDFVLTIRFLKQLLQTSPTDREAFLDVCPGELVQEIVDGVVATGDEFRARHAEAFAHVVDRTGTTR